MANKIEIFQIDAFTKEVFRGNPAGVTEGKVCKRGCGCAGSGHRSGIHLCQKILFRTSPENSDHLELGAKNRCYLQRDRI